MSLGSCKTKEEIFKYLTGKKLEIIFKEGSLIEEPGSKNNCSIDIIVNDVKEVIVQTGLLILIQNIMLPTE
jgi:hypothetical protein